MSSPTENHLRVIDENPFMIGNSGARPHNKHAHALRVIEVKESDLYYDFELDVPGYSLDGISIRIKRGNLIVKGKKERLIDGINNGYIRKENHIERFERKFELDFLADPENISARLEAGVLKLRITRR